MVKSRDVGIVNEVRELGKFPTIEIELKLIPFPSVEVLSLLW